MAWSPWGWIPPTGWAPTRAEHRENRGNGGHLQIATTTDAKQPRPSPHGDPFEGRSVWPDARRDSTVFVSDGSSAEATKPNRVFGGDFVSVMLLCVVHHVAAFEMDMICIFKRREVTGEEDEETFSNENNAASGVLRILEGRRMLLRRPRPPPRRLLK